jgi:DNA polymerase/3'-5' exonuclease PolX
LATYRWSRKCRTPTALSINRKTNPSLPCMTDKQHYGAALLLATGSEEHLKDLREIAAFQGMTADKDGLRKGDKFIASKSKERLALAPAGARTRLPHEHQSGCALD